jgi:potassium-dependent mechanosensitive channel
MSLHALRHRTRIGACLGALLLSFALLLPASAQTTQPAPPAATATQPPATPPQGQAALPEEIAAPVAKLTSAIEDAEKAIQHLTQLEEELGRLRVDVEGILSDSTDTAETLRPQLAAVRSQIEKLGPPPGKDAPPEAPAIAAERARLSALGAQLDGAIKATELTWVRARQLIEKITVLRHSLFTKNLMERMPSPLLPELWRDLVNESPNVKRRVTYLGGDWLRWASGKETQLALLIAAAIVLFGALRYGAVRLTARRSTADGPPPSFFERGMSVAWITPLRALPAIAAAMLLYGGLDALDLLYPPWGRAGGAVFRATFEISAVTALIQAVLAPREPRWRLVSLDDPAARRIARLLYGITIVYAVDGALTEISRAFFVPLALSVVQSFAATTAFAGLLIGLLLTPFSPQRNADAPPEDTAALAPARGPVSRHTPRTLKWPLWVLALAIMAAAVSGYVALARFVSQQLVLTGIVVVVVWLLYLAIRAVTREPHQNRYPVGELLEARFGLDAPRRTQLTRLTEVALTFALVTCAIPILMLQWGFSGADIRDWFKALLFGMEIGSFRISLARILIGIVLFIALLFATRLFQRWLRDKALKETRMDPGIVNSIDTVVGYAGIAVAALLAVSYAGFDITNFAIVAGALSVGIGFGLQSIVNNFVSGLILLIERPIKVGDRIVVGDQQGLVRRISVRATEIDTFDRASLIVPNSELITGRVLNWTHRDTLGAVNVKVGVGYDSDPEQVIAILKKAADDHPDVLRTPAPGASFDAFGDSALQFSLRVSLPDIGKAGGVQSDLRIAILKALRAANIEIPYNQLDVNVRALDGAKRELARRLDEQANAETRANPTGNGKRIPGEGG